MLVRQHQTRRVECLSDLNYWRSSRVEKFHVSCASRSIVLLVSVSHLTILPPRDWVRCMSKIDLNDTSSLWKLDNPYGLGIIVPFGLTLSNEAASMIPCCFNYQGLLDTDFSIWTVSSFSFGNFVSLDRSFEIGFIFANTMSAPLSGCDTTISSLACSPFKCLRCSIVSSPLSVGPLPGYR